VTSKDNKVGAPIAVEPCASIVLHSKCLGAVVRQGSIIRIDHDDQRCRRRQVAGEPAGRIATGVGGIWLVNRGASSPGSIDTNEPWRGHIAGGASSIVLATALWVTSGIGNRLTRVNPQNNEVIEAIGVGRSPGGWRPQTAVDAQPGRRLGVAPESTNKVVARSRSMQRRRR
jgi:hypothetical protein